MEQHQNKLTKPSGSLGELESISINLANMQGNEKSSAENIHITVLAADHGIVEENVSVFPLLNHF